ncbi:ATP-binding protein [Methylobrevis albus]
MPAPVAGLWAAVGRAINRRLPKSLFGRSMLIVVVPMVIFQSVIAQVFMERHYTLVTKRLSDAVARDIASIVDLMLDRPDPDAMETIQRIAAARLSMSIALQPAADLEPTPPAPLFSLLDETLTASLADQITLPFAVDTVSYERLVEVRIALPEAVLRIRLPRNHAYASNSHIFIVWMVLTAFVLIVVSIVFLRNQIRPIQRLAVAAEMLGRGQNPKDFTPSGAREVRKAAYAFIEMRRRIERQVEQRTTMLAGVSHDLRTILTRFKLELALLPESEEAEALAADVVEMEAMLEAYLAFARGVADEPSTVTDVHQLAADVVAETERTGRPATIAAGGPANAAVRPLAFKRMIANLVGNAVRYGSRAAVQVTRQDNWLTVIVDDDGPGIPEAERDAVFKPFHRLDSARNQDVGGSGLGLAIARDIALTHGGDIRLSTGPLGGLRALVRVPC